MSITRPGELLLAPLQFDVINPPRLSRLGVIDVGSNSVRLVVFDGMARSPAYFYNEKVLCGLGSGLSESGKLNPNGRIRAMAALRRFALLAGRMRLSGMIAVATAAVRDACDGRDFCDEVERETGLQLQVASGSEEARLSAKGVLLGWPDADGLACDMGGASMEFAELTGGRIGRCATAALGPQQIGAFDDPDKRAKTVRKRLKVLIKSVGGAVPRLYLVGGSWRAIARLDMDRVGYPLKVLHAYEPPVEQLLETCRWIQSRDPSATEAMMDTAMQRVPLLPLASEVLAEVLRRLEPGRVIVSAYGLREGLLYRQMPEAMRELDPLIEACRHMEAGSARCPGFGDALYDWLQPLYAARSAADLRLVRAACLLHDVNWRAHPDYRAELCFESVVRASFAGLDHPERLFLGLALLNRYKVSASMEEVRRYEGLLLPEQVAEAAILGRAMRLGAMLSGAATGVLENSTICQTEGKLVLTLSGSARGLAGEAVDRRLQTLASRLGCSGEVSLRP